MPDQFVVNASPVLLLAKVNGLAWMSQLSAGPLIVPAHCPVKRSTLAHILKQTELELEALPSAWPRGPTVLTSSKEGDMRMKR